MDKRTKGGMGFRKLMAISILAIGLFSMAFIGINHLAFAASTAVTINMPLLPESVTIPTVSTLPEASAVTASRSNEARRLNIGFAEWYRVGAAAGTPTVDCLSIVEAAEIATDVLEQLFGANLDDSVLFMNYRDGADDMPAFWEGMVFPGDVADFNIATEFVFSIDASTGELITASYNPDAVENYESGTGGRFGSSGFIATDETVDAMNRLMEIPDYELNDSIANLAMETVYNAELLTGTVTRAKIISAAPDGATNPRGPYLLIQVDVQNENEESVHLTFRQNIGEEPVLIAAMGQTATASSNAFWEEMMVQLEIRRHESLFAWKYR